MNSNSNSEVKRETERESVVCVSVREDVGEGAAGKIYIIYRLM